MDYSYTHDDATMVVFDLYSKMLEETGYSVDSPDGISFEQLNSSYAFYSKLFNMLHELGYTSPDTDKAIGKVLVDIYDRAICIKAVHDMGLIKASDVLKELPSVEAEMLTDKEQRIFLAAMEREERVCKEVDSNFVREPYEDSLVQVCKEIRRKVKGALWS